MSRPGLGWVALGVAIAVASWQMDRLDTLHIEPWSAPGLVPGVLGALMAAFGLTLMRRPASLDAENAPLPRGRLLGVLALCAVFSFGMLGHLSFAPSAAALIFVWISMLRLRHWQAEEQVLRGVRNTALIALLGAYAIAHLFQDLFLVRLP